MGRRSIIPDCNPMVFPPSLGSVDVTRMVNMIKRKSVIFLITALLCGVVLLLGYFQYMEARSRLLELYADKQMLLIEQIAAGIEKYFISHTDMLKMLAQKHKQSHLASLQHDHNTEEIYSKILSDGHAVFVNRHNQFVCAYPKSVPSDSLFPFTLRNQALALFHSDSASAQPVIFAANAAGFHSNPIYFFIPVFDKKDTFIGVMIASIDLGKIINDILTPTMQAYGDRTFILSDSGTILYHPYHPQMVSRNIYRDEQNCRACHFNFDLEKTMLNQTKGWGIKEDRQKASLLTFAQISSNRIKWSVVMDARYETLSHTNRRLFIIFVILSSSLSAIVLLGSLGFYRINKRRLEMEKNDEQRRRNHLAFIGEMSTRIAHEIKNPLASLQTGIQLLESTLKMDDDSREYFQRLTSEIRRVDDIVKGLLSYSREEQLNKTETDIALLLLHVVELIKPTIKESEIDWRLDLPDSQYTVSIDAQKIEQVLWNLLINAIQAVGKKGIIEVRLRKEKKAKVKITIRDNGCGISEQHLPKVFQPFFSTRSQGTGLGLAICQKIIQAHNGSIKIKSAVHEGTKVKIII